MNFFKKLLGSDKKTPKEDNTKNSNERPPLDEVLLREGEYYFGEGNYQGALVLFDRALRANPNSGAAWSGKGNCFAVLEKFDEALECYNKALSINPSEAGYYYNKARLLADNGSRQEAIEIYQHSIKLDENHLDSLNNLGICYIEEGDKEKAYSYFKTALDKNPKHKPSLLNNISILRDLGKHDEAEKLSHDALELYRNDEEFIVDVAQSQFVKAGIESALKLFDELYADTRNVEIILYKARFLYQHDKKEAMNIMDNYLSLNPKNIDAWGLKSTLHTEFNDFEGQLNSLNKILEIDGKNFRALNDKIIALYNLNRKEEALNTGLLLFSYYPQNIDIFSNIMVILREVKPKDEVIEVMDRLAEMYPDNRYNLLYRKGLIYMHYQEYSKAIDVFSSLNNEHKFAWNYYQIGIINNILGNIEECLKYLKKTFALDPSLIEDARNLASLDNLRTNSLFNELLGEMEIKKETNEEGIDLVSVHFGSHGNNFSALFGYEDLADERNKNFLNVVLAHALSLPKIRENDGIAVSEKSLNPHEGKDFFLKVRAMKFETGDVSFTAFPVLQTNKAVSFETKKIHEWAHYGKVEAEVYGNVHSIFGVGFFATDYAYNKNIYQTNKNIRVKISAFALSLYEGYPENLWGNQLADNFSGYLPNDAMKQNCYYDFVTNVIGYKRVKADHDIEGYLLTLTLALSGSESKNFVIDVFVNEKNMNFKTLTKGMRVSGILWFQGEIDS